jgi:hypothetical protein
MREERITVQEQSGVFVGGRSVPQPHFLQPHFLHRSLCSSPAMKYCAVSQLTQQSQVVIPTFVPPFMEGSLGDSD